MRTYSTLSDLGGAVLNSIEKSDSILREEESEFFFDFLIEGMMNVYSCFMKVKA